MGEWWCQVSLTWDGCHQRLDTEHMLLGVLAEGEGAGIQVLTALDVDVMAVRQSVLDRVARQAS